MRRHLAESAGGKSASTPAGGNSRGNAKRNPTAARSSRNDSASRSAATSATLLGGSAGCANAASTSWSMQLSDRLLASLSVLPGHNVELPTRDTYSHCSWELFASCTRNGSSWNRCPPSSVSTMGKRSRNISAAWPRSGTTSFGTAYRLAPLARVIAATGSGLLPTPEASNTKARAARSGGRPPRDFLKMIPTPRAAFDSGRHRGRADTLHSWIKLYPTPHASCGTGAGMQGRRGGLNLQTFVRLFPTPTARDYKDGAARACGHLPVKSLLGRAVHQWPSTRRTGRKPSPHGGSLNPEWVEWLMGFPAAWTDSRAWAMRSSRKSRFLSARRSIQSSASRRKRT
jgi:hypothetical protein